MAALRASLTVRISAKCFSFQPEAGVLILRPNLRPKVEGAAERATGGVAEVGGMSVPRMRCLAESKTFRFLTATT